MDSYYTGVPLSLAKGTDYEVLNACYDSADAGQKKTVSFTIKLKNAGYVFEDGTTQKDFTLNGADFDDKTFQINKATAPMNNPAGTLNITNGTCQTYTYDFNNILPGLPKGKYGTISYGRADISLVSQSGYYYDETIVEFKKGVLTLAQFYAKDGTMTGQIGTVKVNVTTTNYENFQLKLVLNAVDQIKPTPDGTITASEITYGDTLSMSEISGKMKDPDTGKSVNGTFAWTDGTINPNAGDYEADWTFTPDAPEYAALTGKTTVKVAPKSIEGATLTLEKDSLKYNATEQSPKITDVTLEGWPEIITYRIVGGDKATNANDSITLTIEGTGNYTGTATAEWKINPAELTVSAPSEVKKAYDGTTNATVTPTFNGLQGGDRLIAADYSVTADFDNANVGYKKTVAGTVKLNQTDAAKNYVLTNDGNFSTDDGTIAKAVAPTVQPVELTIYNGVKGDYYVDLPPLPDLDEGKSYGTEDYSKPHTINLSEGYTAQSAIYNKVGSLDTKLLALRMNQTGSLTGEIGTVTIPVATSNYQDIALTVTVKAVNQTLPKVGTVSADAITYGQTLSASIITGTMQDPATGDAVNGTFTWDTPAMKLDAGSHDAKWTFTPDKSYGGKYTTNTGTATVVVNPKAVTVNITPNGGTYGSVTAAAAVLSGVVDGETVPVTLTYTGTANDGTEYTGTTPPTKAGTYTVTATTTNPNYTLDPKTTTADFTIAKRPATVTPDNKSKVYEEKDPELTYIVSGVLSGETLKGITLARAEGENAGQYAITATADAGANPNYEVTFAKGTLTIEPKSIKGAKVVLGKGLTANGAEQTQTVEKVLLDDKEIPADSYTVAGNTATAPGRYTLTVTAKGNYTGTVEQTYAIAYKDTAVPSSSKPSSNNSSNDSETKKNEVAAPTPASASTSKPSTITAMPQTGDTSNPTLYVVLLVASLLGLAVVFVCKKRNDK